MGMNVDRIAVVRGYYFLIVDPPLQGFHCIQEVNKGCVPVDSNLVRCIGAIHVSVGGFGLAERIDTFILLTWIWTAHEKSRYWFRDKICYGRTMMRVHGRFRATAGNEAIAGCIPAEDIVTI